MLRSGGLVTGLDTNALVKQLVAIERLPIGKLQQKKSAYQTQLSSIGSIQSALKNLQTKVKGMDTAREFIAMTGTSTDDTAFKVIATGDAAPASYTLEVKKVANAEKNRSAGYASATSEVTEGTLSINLKGAGNHDVTIAAGDTLQDVIANINDKVTGATASLISDGTNFYLSLTADETGFTLGGVANDAVVLTESYTGGSGSALGLAQITTAVNAEVILDGLTVQSEKNAIQTAVGGVTITVIKPTTAVETMTVAPDKTAIKAKVQEFVDAYNTAAGLVVKATTVAAGTNRATSLAGDATIRNLRSVLSRSISQGVPSLAGSPYNCLATIGVTTDRVTGKLKVSTEKLDKALDNSVLKVSRLFTAADGLPAGLTTALKTYTAVDGVLVARSDGINQNIKSIDRRITALDLRVQTYEQTLVKTFTQLELSVLRIQEQGKALSGSF